MGQAFIQREGVSRMLPVTSARFLDADSSPPVDLYVRVEVWLGWFAGRRRTASTASLSMAARSTSTRSKQVRRTLNGVTVDATDEMWDLLSPVGTQLRAFRGFRYLNGEVRGWCPAGVFVMPNIYRKLRRGLGRARSVTRFGSNAVGAARPVHRHRGRSRQASEIADVVSDG
jgi:hypothetical protein